MNDPPWNDATNPWAVAIGFVATIGVLIGIPLLITWLRP